MTSKPFSTALNDFIVNIIRVRSLATATDWELASRIWGAMENTDSFAREGHDFDAVLNQVKNLRAAHMGSDASAAGNATAYRRNNVYSATQPAGATPPGGGGGAGSTGGSWRTDWNNFTSTFGANARNWGNTARSAWGGAGGAGGSGGGPGGGGGGRGRGGGGGGRGRGRWWNWGGGGGGSGRGRGGRRGPGRPGRGPSSPGFGAAMGHAWGRFSSGIHGLLEPWLLQQFQPTAHGFFGKAGGAAGISMGGAFGGAAGMVTGQALGTVIGNFVDNMKVAVVQAREFGMALKESNRRFIYYNASIAMSYVESDFAEMRRNFSIARAIAPSAVSMNRNLTTYQQTIMPWDIFRQNMSYEGRGAALGVAQTFAEVGRPVAEWLNFAREYISPDGNFGYKAAKLLTTATLRTMLTSVYSSIPFIGPMLNLAGNMLANFLPKPDVQPGQQGPIGPWERLVDNPNKIPPRDAQFNQMPMRPLGGRNRF